MPALSRTGGSAARRVSSGIVLATALLSQISGAQADDLDRIRERALVLLNQSRKEHKLPPLVLEAKLNNAAQGHASDMLKRNISPIRRQKAKPPPIDISRQVAANGW